jgi:hypothetical protein
MKMNHENSIGFHEAGIVNISTHGGTISLLLEGVHVSAEKVSGASVRLVNVSYILRDGVPSEEIAMEYQDGEVLTLDIRSDSVQLIVLWNDFKRHLERTISYRVQCERVEVQIEV